MNRAGIRLTTRMARAIATDLTREGRTACAHVRGRVSRAGGAARALGWWLVGTDPAIRKVVAYSLETGEVSRGGKPLSRWLA